MKSNCVTDILDPYLDGFVKAFGSGIPCKLVVETNPNMNLSIAAGDIYIE